MAIDGGKIISHLELDTGRYTAAMAAAKAQAERFAADNATIGTKLQASLGVMSTIGRMATGALTVPIAGAAAASGKVAISFESAFAGVRKTVDATEAEYARLNKTLLDMGRVVPKLHEELAGIMEAGGQLGVPQEKLEKFTRVIADLDVATNLTGEAGASMLAQYANVKQMDLDNIDRLGSVIVDLGNKTATTELDIVNMAQRLSGAAGILKLTDAQTMGLAATMSSLGINAEAGGSAMSRVMQRMLKDVRAGGEGLKVYAQTAGLTAESFANLFNGDPLAAITAFIDGLSALNESGGDIYGVLGELGLEDLRITDSLLRMTGAQGMLEKNIQLANKAWDENIALTREAEQRYGTTESKIKLARNSIREAGIDIGNAFLPVIGDAAEGVANLANRFADLDQEQQRQIITGAGIAASIGPATLLLKGVIGLMSGPGGLIAAAGLGALALAGISAASKEITFARLGEELGDIKLSSEEVKKIVDAGFGAPLIDFSKLESARQEADDAKQSFIDLQEQLEKETYLVRMGVETLTPAEVDAKVSTLVSAANTYLAKEENAARMTITAYFGEGSAEAGTMLAGLDAVMVPLKKDAADKGKELGDIMKAAIADGYIDAEEAKVIGRLQSEFAEIVARAAIMESESKREVMIAKARRSGLSVETIREADKQTDEYEKALLKDYETVRDANLNIAAGTYVGGGYTEDEYKKINEAIFDRFEFYKADVHMGTLDTRWRAYMAQLAENFLPKIAETKSLLNTPGFIMDSPGFENIEERTKIRNYSDEAKAMLGELGNTFQMLSEMKGKLGDDMPAQYQGMLEFLQQLQALANLSQPDEDLLKTAEPVDTAAIDKAVDEQVQRVRQRLQIGLEGAKEDMAAPAAEAGRSAIQSANQAAEDEEVHIEDTLTKPLAPIPGAYSDTGRESGANIVNQANASAEGADLRVDDAMTAPLAGLPAAYGSIGSQAVNTLVGRLQAGVGPVTTAAGKLGTAMDGGIKKTLEIASPPKTMLRIADNVTGTLANQMKVGLPKVESAAQRLGTGIVGKVSNPGAAADSGYRDAVLAGRQTRPATNPLSGMTYIPGDVWAAMDQIPKTDKTTKPRGGGGGGGAPSASYAPPPPDYSRGVQQTLAKVEAERGRINAELAKYDADRARLLDMAGPWRAYYDKTEIDKLVQAVQDKYQAMMDAEQQGFDALSEGERQARSQAHSQLMQQLRQSQQDEVARIKENYDLQRRLATDWLTAQADLMSKAFSDKQEAARADDYEKEVADLEKRLRQSRSAREKRELGEELERMRRDEALRQEQQELQSALQGFRALQNAVNQGIIGLGDLTGDRTLPASAFGAGLRHVQGITADQLQSVLGAIADRQAQQGGNHYTVDLSGAIIRDDSDIDRIVSAFEERNRSIQRDLNTWR